MDGQVIVFDLDGTLLDSSERLYRLFQDLVPMSELTKSEYWGKKREGYSHRAILQSLFPHIDIGRFEREWLSLVETERYLNLDRLYGSVSEILQELKKDYLLLLLTARQSRSMLLQELQKLGVASLFDSIFITEGVQSKERRLQEILARYTAGQPAYLVSDAAGDICVGNRLGMTTLGITYGFTDPTIMKMQHPAICIDDPMEILDVFQKAD